MQNAFDEVERLFVLNAQHRKGWRLQDQKRADILRHAREELRELMESPLDADELADVLGCVINLAVSAGLSFGDIETKSIFDSARYYWLPSMALGRAGKMLKAIEHSANHLDEKLAYVFGCMLCYSDWRAWSQEEIEQRLIVKLAIRFTNK